MIRVSALVSHISMYITLALAVTWVLALALVIAVAVVSRKP